ncbi:ABC transporter permease [Streptacidiphilus carbonis]|uniref:ABC transporter permease n=1 Tax=Streptacidiphilus carbonis TaxID=105422 RepID=UPI0005A77038|nr:ABC transporter permease [Streptacidiphilus carbonis]
MTVIAVPRTGGSAYTLRAVIGETTKGLLLLWRRRAVLIMATVSVGLIYLMIEFFVGAGRIDHGVLAATLPGLFAYAVASSAAVQGCGGIAEEINSGTLEQAHLSPVPPSLLVLGRLGALAAEGLIPAVVLTAAFWTGFGVHYTVRPDALVPVVLTVADALAYGLLMAALTVAVSSIGALGHVFNMIVMFFGGIFVPVTAYPHGVVIFARFVPTTLGVEVLNTALAGRGLGAAWTDGTLPWLLVHVVVLGSLGWYIYTFNIRRARREGGLSA